MDLTKETFKNIYYKLFFSKKFFYTLDNYQSVLWDLEYGYKLSNHFDVKAIYNFNYSRLQVPSAYRELQHQLNLGINYKF